MKLSTLIFSSCAVLALSINATQAYANYEVAYCSPDTDIEGSAIAVHFNKKTAQISVLQEEGYLIRPSTYTAKKVATGPIQQMRITTDSGYVLTIPNTDRYSTFISKTAGSIDTYKNCEISNWDLVWNYRQNN